jgi:polyhydroxybutyrate depolymerase
MSQQRKASLWVFMMTVSLVASSSSAQETQGNPQPPSRREGLGGKRPQQQPGDPRKQINPRQRDAVRKLRERTENGPVPPGLDRRKIQVGQSEREYFINIPQSCQGKPSPVVFVLHGGATSSGIAMHLKTDFTKLGASAGYVTVYPSGINGWNIGSHDMFSVQRRTSNADDVGFFRAMFGELIEKKIADPDRIYVVGGSNGGVMTQFLVCNLADRIAAAGVMVATLPRAAETKWPKPTKPVPMIVLLGTEDPMKPWSGNRDQMSAQETIAYWRKQNKCDSDGKQWDLPDKDPRDGCRIHAERWDGAAPVVFYTMQGHGHGWPMQRRRTAEDKGQGTNDISAPEEYWAFFDAMSKTAP